MGKSPLTKDEGVVVGSTSLATDLETVAVNTAAVVSGSVAVAEGWSGIMEDGLTSLANGGVDMEGSSVYQQGRIEHNRRQSQV